MNTNDPIASGVPGAWPPPIAATGADSAGATAPEVPSRRGAALWDGALPEMIGLALATVLVGSLAAVGVIGQRSLHRHEALHRAQTCGLLAQSLASALGSLPERSALTAEIILTGPSVSNPEFTVRWLGDDGAVRFESAPRPGERSGPAVSAPVVTAGGANEGRVEVTCSGGGGVGGGGALWRDWWLVTAASLGAFLVLYRRLRRNLRPIQAVESSLRAYASGVECDLRSLALGDGFGRVASAWNSLIEELAEARAGGAGGREEPPSDVLARFETRKLLQVLDRMPVGLLRVGGDRRVTYANASAGELLESPAAALVGRPLGEVLDESAIARALSESSARPVSVDRASSKGQRETAMRVLVAPLDADARHGERLVTIQDITHLHEAERARDKFLYHVTHELRTPLTNIQAYAETLTRSDFDDEQTRKECYNIIMSETRRLSRLVEDILSVSQLEAGTARIEPGDVDLTRLLRQTVQDHLGHADEKKIDLTLELPPKPPKFRGDKQRLAVLFNNLIGNALKYTPGGGRVQVRLEVEEGNVRVSVADNGVGIAAEDQPHVFEKFYRAAAQADEVPGTGLGLAIAREVARLHGGDIRVQSEAGRGSTFTVELPAAET